MYITLLNSDVTFFRFRLVIFLIELFKIDIYKTVCIVQYTTRKITPLKVYSMACEACLSIIVEISHI